MDFFGHFDIWNNLEKKNFSNFFIIHREDPDNFSHNRKGPPYEFWKNEKKMQKIFFFNLIPDIKMYAQTMNKNDFRIFLTQLVSPQ